MLILRSSAFNALFYLNTIIYLIIGLPTFFMPYRAIVGVAKSWGRTNLVLLRVVAGIDCDIRGREKIPKGPLIVASKHQSAWETFALLPLLENIHGETHHCGKFPKRAPDESQKRYQLIKLRNDLRLAVAEESYEEAARLRDQIQELEGQTSEEPVE